MITIDNIQYKLINIEGNNGRYYISECGEVWDNKTKKKISQFLTGIPQYKYVNLTLEGGRKLKRVHNLNLRTYVPYPDDGDTYYADHIDRDKMNNHPSDRDWETYLY